MTNYQNWSWRRETLKRKLVILNLNFFRWTFSLTRLCIPNYSYYWLWWVFFCLQLNKAIAERSPKILSLEKRINDIVDRIYKKFSESVGVENIREYEENQLSAAQHIAEQKLRLRNQQSKLKYQYVYLPFVVHYFLLFIGDVAFVFLVCEWWSLPSKDFHREILFPLNILRT